MIGETHSFAASRWTATGRRPAEDQPLDSWLKQELGRAYDDALDETLPEELLDLLRDVPPHQALTCRVDKVHHRAFPRRAVAQARG